MISFSPTVVQIINDGKAECFFFGMIQNANNTLVRTFTTHHSTFTAWNGVEYIADDFLVSADPPQQSSTVDREQYKITLVDNEFMLAALAENGLVGKKLHLMLGFINPDNGQPLVTNPIDVLTIYRGRVDGMGAVIDTNEVGSFVFNLSAASPMVSLDQTNGIYLSRDVMRGRNQNDSCCDVIYAGSAGLMYKWGRQ